MRPKRRRWKNKYGEFKELGFYYKYLKNPQDTSGIKHLYKMQNTGDIKALKNP